MDAFAFGGYGDDDKLRRVNVAIKDNIPRQMKFAVWPGVFTKESVGPGGLFEELADAILRD